MKRYEKDIASLPSLDVIRDSVPRASMLPAEYFSYNGKYLFYGAHEFAESVGIYDSMNALDVEATAKRLFIPVRYTDMLQPKAYISGVHPHRGVLKQEIVLSSHDSDTRTSFGHELGHLFLEEMNRSASDELDHFDLEVLCDFIGRRISLPSDQISELDRISESTLLDLSKKHKIPLRSVVLRLIEEGLLPDNVFIDTYLPESGNSDFSHKITRCSVCLMCEMHIRHDHTLHSGNHALFDFTDRAWAYQFSRCPDNFIFELDECELLTHTYALRNPQLALFPPQ